VRLTVEARERAVGLSTGWPRERIDAEIVV